MKKTLGILGLLLFLWALLAVCTANPWYDVLGSTFLKPNNIENLLTRTAMFGLLGVGVAFVIIHSGIDLSIGSAVCLAAVMLSLFLHVEYLPFDSLPVVEVKGNQREIRVIDKGSTVEVGDVVRFEAGSRARDALLTVTNVTVENGIRMISVDRPLTNDDVTGRLNPTLGIVAFSRGSGNTPSTITIPGEHSMLQARDRIMAYHATGGAKELRIESAAVESGNTRITLSNDLGSDFSDMWRVVPVERRQRMPIPVAVLSVIGIGLLLGLCHGLLVTAVKLQPFVVTLCGLLIYRSIARTLVNDNPPGFGTEYTHTLRPLAQGKLMIWRQVNESGELVNGFGIPYPFLIFLAVAIVAAVFLNQTVWGRYLLALGRNENAARYSGINTNRIVILAYMICTALAMVGGMLWGLDSNSISPSSFGSFFELYAIAAAVLGGCSLRGGEGSIFGVLIGTAVMQTLNNLIMLMKIPPTLEFAIIGMVILLGVIADEMLKRYNAKRRAIAQAKAWDGA